MVEHLVQIIGKVSVDVAMVTNQDKQHVRSPRTDSPWTDAGIIHYTMQILRSHRPSHTEIQLEAMRVVPTR